MDSFRYWISSQGSSPEGHSGAATADSVTDITAMLASSIKDIIAAQMNAFTEGLQSCEPPYTPQKKGNKHYPFRSPTKPRPRTQMRQELMVYAPLLIVEVLKPSDLLTLDAGTY